MVRFRALVSVTDASGTLLAINSYDEFGIPGSANVGRFQYTGQAWLPELGMYHYKNRIYSPSLGRFLQTDPIGTEGGINLYAYVTNDPVNLVDPLGLEIVVPGWRCGGTWVDDEFGNSTCVSSVEFIGPSSVYRYFLDPELFKGGLITNSTKEIIDEVVESITQLFCSIPPLEVTAGADAYLGVGASGSVGGSFDIRTLQARGVSSATLGVGYGGGIGVSIAPGSTESGIASQHTATFAYGPVSVTASPDGLSSTGTGPQFGPQVGGWAGETWTFTSKPTPSVNGGC